MIDLAPLAIAGRLDRLRAGIDGAQCDAVVVTNLTNVRYLSGFSGSSGFLIITPDAAVLITDGRYETQAHEQIAAAGTAVRVVITSTEQRAEAVAAIGDRPRVGLEAAAVTWAQLRQYEEWFEGAALVPTEGLVESQRLVKEDGEIARIALAAQIADAALSALRSQLLAGPTEREFAVALEREMGRRGATGPAFETIVASGPNAAKPHYRPGDRPIAPGDLVVVDFGAVVEGYRSDMTRTLMVGEPAPEARRIFDVVVAAQAAGVAAVGPGVEAKVVDAACREFIASAGWGERFVHGTGHGVGLDIHEAPWVNARSAATLSSGNIVTVEPGVYVPDVGGVRIEDTLLVTPSGHRVLTKTPKDPSVE